MAFWPGKRVLVTGGAGFLGSFVCERLVRLGAGVAVLDNHSRGHNTVEGVAYFEGDVGEYSVCHEAFQGCDVVLNLAAYVAGLLYNTSHQFEMFERNVRLQLTPVRVARDLAIKHFLQVSSVCVYSPIHAINANEEFGQLGEPVSGNSGYSWAKRMGERAALWAGLQHMVIVRPSNLYGPRDHFDERAHVIPALIRKCLEQSTILVHGTGNEEREFLYVEDAAEGLLLALERGENGEVYNLGTHGSTKVSVVDLVRLIQHYTATKSKPVQFIGGDGGDPVRYSDCLKMSNATGWWHTTLLEDGLKRTIDWYVQEQSAI